MNRRAKHKRFVICICNHGYEASLERGKLYRAIPDTASERRRLLRIIDESGEDYVYPDGFFAPIELPKAVEKALAVAG